MTVDIDKIISQPIFFNKNRVFRNYKGGAGFDKLVGDKSEDGDFPEEWLCSKVKAINPKYFGVRDGCAVVENTEFFFDDLLNRYPAELLGGKKYDCLVKYLDSAIRLPVQTHPTKEFSRKYFNSDYGKTEAWLVLSTRDENAKLYFGFKDKIDLETLKEYADRSLDERDVLTEIITPVKANVGDIYLIRAGLIHAIGAGCTILEAQEPTDFTLQIENWCGDYRVTEQEKYLGLPQDVAMSCFNYDMYGQNAVKLAKITPKTVLNNADVKIESLISYDDTPCFAENRYTLSGGKTVMQNAPAVWAIVEGSGLVTAENYVRELKSGDYFFLPHSAVGRFELSGNLTAVECLSSK